MFATLKFSSVHGTLEKLHCGPKVKLIFSISTMGTDAVQILTDPIDIDNKAIIILKFYTLNPATSSTISVKMKNKENATNFIVLNINYKDFNKIFCCVDEWTEAQIIKDVQASTTSQHPYEGRYIRMFTFKICITVSDMRPISSVHNKLYEDTEFTDFQLQAADGTVPVHKAMLFIHSDMFRTMLSGEWKETAEGRINIDGVTVQTLQHLKDYMYLGNLPDEGLELLLVISVRYLMDKLKTDCITKVVRTFKPENLDKLVEIACQTNIPELVKALFLRIPDEIVTGIDQVQVNQETDDKK